MTGDISSPGDAALEITNLILARRIKNETENTVLINADRHGNADARWHWYLSLLNELSKRLSALELAVVVFFRKSECELASEVGNQVFRISSVLDCDTAPGSDEEADTMAATILTRENSGEPVSFEIRLE